eukprot:SAG31_NODE_6655_length_1921_cov_2.049564_1_plen_82_part_00
MVRPCEHPNLIIKKKNVERTPPPRRGSYAAGREPFIMNFTNLNYRNLDSQSIRWRTAVQPYVRIIYLQLYLGSTKFSTSRY